MGTISDKLTYLNETKSQLKDMINYGLPTENQITNETTFRNYVKGIFEAFIESLRDSTTLYTNLPKISGNGTQITLNDTANAPMRITLKASELTQDGTPTPDNPQDIHTISGNNSVVVEGKNLAKSFYSPQVTQNYIRNLFIDFGIKPDTTYTFSFETNQSGAAFYWNESVFTTSQPFTSQSTGRTTFTATTKNKESLDNLSQYDKTENGYAILKNYRVQDTTPTFANVQVEYGSTATTYTPYVSQTAPLNLPVENLLENKLTSQTISGVTFTTNQDKTITANGTATASIYLNLNTEVTLGAGTYKLSGCPSGGSSSTYTLYENSKGYNSFDYGSGLDITLTESKTFRVSLAIYSGTTVNNLVFKPMLQKGTKAHSYTPYGTTPIEYCKIGNYEDEFVRSGGEQLFDIGTSNSDYDNLNNASPSYLTINGNTLSMVIQSGGGTRFYRKQNLIGNNTFTINCATSVNEARYFVRIRKIDNSGWLSSSDYTFTDGWTYNQYYGGWYTNIRNGNNTKTFTIPNCLYWQIGFGWDTNIYEGTTQTMSNIMLNKGTTALPYVPYEKGWYYKQGIGKVVLDGSEDENYDTYFYVSGNGGIRFRYLNINNIANPGRWATNTLFSNRFKQIDQAQANEGSYGIQIINAIIVRVLESDCTTVSDFKNWLSTHNTNVYYQLSTPTYTQITGTLETQLNNIYEKLLSYKGTTNISQVNNDLPFVLGVSAIQDLE